MRENNISIAGLEQISIKSIEKMQDKRNKSLSHIMLKVKELNLLIRDITILETKYKRSL